MMILDYNEDRSLQASSNLTKAGSTSNKSLDFGTAVQSIQASSAKVVINTLSPYTGFGGGSYQMSAVKRMTAKEDFLNMELTDRNCNIELFEVCRAKMLLEECNCVPWEMSVFQVEMFEGFYETRPRKLCEFFFVFP